MRLSELFESADNAVCVKCGSDYAIPSITIKHTQTVECPTCGHHNDISKSLKAYKTTRGTHG